MVSKPFNPSRRITGFQKDGLAFDVPKLSQTLPEGLSKVRVRGRRPRQEHPDSGNFLRLLRLGGGRRKNADSEKDREPDQPHGHLGGGWLAGV